MLRTEASFSLKLMKINRRNFEDALHGSAIFEDINQSAKKELSRVGARFSSKQHLEF